MTRQQSLLRALAQLRLRGTSMRALARGCAVRGNVLEVLR